MSPLAISLASFAALFLLIYLGWERAGKRRGQQLLLARVGVKGAGAGEAPTAVSLPQRIRGSVTKVLSARSPARSEWHDRWIAPSMLAGALVGGLVTWKLLQTLEAPSPGLGVTAGIGIGAWIGWALCRRWQRQWLASEISHGLIDLLDLWIMCLDAGMSFQAALARAAQDSDLARPVLRRELQLTHQEIMAGCPSEEALRHLVARCGPVTELSGLVSHIIQSEKLGGSIAKTLQVYANSLRFNRYQDMKEAVQKMPAKLAFPLIFCILPCLLIVIAGPAFLRFYEVLGRR